MPRGHTPLWLTNDHGNRRPIATSTFYLGPRARKRPALKKAPTDLVDYAAEGSRAACPPTPVPRAQHMTPLTNALTRKIWPKRHWKGGKSPVENKRGTQPTYTRSTATSRVPWLYRPMSAELGNNCACDVTVAYTPCICWRVAVSRRAGVLRKAAQRGGPAAVRRKLATKFGHDDNPHVACFLFACITWVWQVPPLRDRWCLCCAVAMRIACQTARTAR